MHCSTTHPYSLIRVDIDDPTDSQVSWVIDKPLMIESLTNYEDCFRPGSGIFVVLGCGALSLRNLSVCRTIALFHCLKGSKVEKHSRVRCDDECQCRDLM